MAFLRVFYLLVGIIWIGNVLLTEGQPRLSGTNDVQFKGACIESLQPKSGPKYQPWPQQPWHENQFIKMNEYRVGKLGYGEKGKVLDSNIIHAYASWLGKQFCGRVKTFDFDAALGRPSEEVYEKIHETAGYKLKGCDEEHVEWKNTYTLKDNFTPPVAEELFKSYTTGGLKTGEAMYRIDTKEIGMSQQYCTNKSNGFVALLYWPPWKTSKGSSTEPRCVMNQKKIEQTEGKIVASPAWRMRMANHVNANRDEAKQTYLTFNDKLCSSAQWSLFRITENSNLPAKSTESFISETKKDGWGFYCQESVFLWEGKVDSNEEPNVNDVIAFYREKSQKGGEEFKQIFSDDAKEMCMTFIKDINGKIWMGAHFVTKSKKEYEYRNKPVPANLTKYQGGVELPADYEDSTGTIQKVSILCLGVITLGIYFIFP